MRTFSRVIHLGACISALASAAALSACGAVDGPPDAGPAQAAPRLDLSVVAIRARIGEDVVPSTGTVLDAERGLVLTTAHSVWGATSLKVTTGLAVVHGRIVARDACDNLALVETQPRLPGLVGVGTASAPAGGSVAAAVVRRDSTAPAVGPQSVVRTAAQAGGAPSEAPARVPTPPDAVRLAADLPRSATGAPVLDADDRLIGMSLVVPRRGPDTAAMLPWQAIDARMRELQPGTGTIYVGWRKYYACAPALHAHARAAHPGYRPQDAKLNAAIPVSRLPGSSVEGG